MKKDRPRLGVQIHQAFHEMAQTQQRLVQIEMRQQMEKERLKQKKDPEDRQILSDLDRQIQDLFLRIEQKSQKIEHLKTLIRRTSG